MKSKPWLWGGLVWLTAASVLAQDPAGDANPSALPRSVIGSLSKDVVLNPPGVATAKLESLLVRSLPSFAGNHLTTLKKGQSVTVLEQVTLAKPKAGEPANWARIALPPGAAVWVFAQYIDTNTMTISARRVNVRAGADEKFDVVAHLEKGAPVREVRRVPGWVQIEPPTNAYGFVAADYLTMEPAATPPPAAVMAEIAAVAAPVAPPPTNTTPAPESTNTTPVAVAPPIIAPEPVATTPVMPATNSTPPVAATPDTNALVAAAPVAAAPPSAAAPAKADDSAGIDKKPRIVTREGYVRKAINIQAPADYELHDLNSGQLIEYLQPDAKDKNFKKYTGTRVSITGPELLDRRWPKTPILQVQTVDLMP